MPLLELIKMLMIFMRLIGSLLFLTLQDSYFVLVIPAQDVTLVVNSSAIYLFC